MDCVAVIRIRYKDFWSKSDSLPGLYGSAVCRGSRVTVYLQPGLSAGQRAAVFRRLRQEASRGCGPELPLPRLVTALAVDRIRMAVRILGGAVRLHPGVTLLPSVLAVLTVTMFVLASAGGPAGQASAGPTSVGGSALTSDQASAGAELPVVTARGIAAGGRGLDLTEHPVPLALRARGKAACVNPMIGWASAGEPQLACRHTASNKAHRPGPRALA
jgi:hypothetical protein